MYPYKIITAPDKSNLILVHLDFNFNIKFSEQDKQLTFLKEYQDRAITKQIPGQVLLVWDMEDGRSWFFPPNNIELDLFFRKHNWDLIDTKIQGII